MFWIGMSIAAFSRKGKPGATRRSRLEALSGGNEIHPPVDAGG
jgi:hypothetical protein